MEMERRTRKFGRSGGGGHGGQRTHRRKERTFLPFGARIPKGVITKDTKVDYKNLSLLQKFLSDRGKIYSRRITGVSAKDQRKVSVAIKQARHLALLPTGGVRK